MGHLKCAPGYVTYNVAPPSSGIGLETSILFASEGANVLLADINLEAAEKAAALISKKSPNVKAIAVKADVGKEEDIKAAVDKAVKEFGRLDVMVRDIRPSICPSGTELKLTSLTRL